MKTMHIELRDGEFLPNASGLADTGISRVVDSLGTPEFAHELMQCLHHASGAEHCVVYGLKPEGVRVVVADSLDGSDYASRRASTYVDHGLWRSDSGFVSAYRGGASQRARLVRVEKMRLTADTSQITQKLFVFGIRHGLYGISVLRNESQSHFSEAAVRRLNALGEFVVSCCDKHSDQSDRHAGAPLASVKAIEEQVSRWAQALTPRELQVCSRILYGMTVEGISLDLRIKPESVVTYRKRAFLKCGIGTRHELMRRYLASGRQAD